MSDYININDSISEVLNNIVKNYPTYCDCIVPNNGFTSAQLGMFHMFEIIFRKEREFCDLDNRIVKMIVEVKNLILDGNNDVAKVFEIGTELCREAFSIDNAREYRYYIPEY
jgi:hypothetical protein